MDSALHILLKRFRRRLILAQVVHLLARACLGVAAICLAAALVQRFTGTPLLAQAAALGAVAAAIWVAIGLRHRPTLAAAALEIDRQRNLRELLSSAALAEGRQGFDACVIAAAADKAAAVRVETLSSGSFGARAWVASLLLAGLLPLVYRAPGRAAEEIASDPLDTAAIAASRTSTAARPVGGQQPQPIPQAQTPGASVITVASEVDDQGRSIAAPRPRPTRSETAGTSAGGGLAQDEQSTVAAPPAPAMIPAQGERGAGNGSGGGKANAGSPGMAVGSGQVSATGGQSEAAESARMQANGQLDAQALPEGYRDVFKAYFAHPRGGPRPR